MNNLIGVSELSDLFGCSRQNINYHLARIKAEYPLSEIVIKNNRKNFVTPEGVELLKERIEVSEQIDKDENKQREANRQKATKQQKQNTTNDKEQSSPFNSSGFSDAYSEEKIVFELKEQLSKAQEELKEKNKQIAELNKLLNELTGLVEQAQLLALHQQELSLIDKKEETQPRQLPGKTEIGWPQKAKIYARAIWRNIRSN